MQLTEEPPMEESEDPKSGHHWDFAKPSQMLHAATKRNLQREAPKSGKHVATQTQKNHQVRQPMTTPLRDSTEVPSHACMRIHTCKENNVADCWILNSIQDDSKTQNAQWIFLFTLVWVCALVCVCVCWVTLSVITMWDVQEHHEMGQFKVESKSYNNQPKHWEQTKEEKAPYS